MYTVATASNVAGLVFTQIFQINFGTVWGKKHTFKEEGSEVETETFL